MDREVSAITAPDTTVLLDCFAPQRRGPLPRGEDAVPDAKLVVIPGAGQVSNLEQPELFNDAVRKFCRAHSPRSA
jgi:pimeloyl-ACP methyl ester carboxylesterase